MAKANRKKRADRAAKRDMVRGAKPLSDRGSNRLFTLPAGVDEVKLPDKGCTVSIDHLPYTVEIDNHPRKIGKGMSWWNFPFMQHNRIGPDEKTFVCPRTFAGNRCACCEHETTLRNDGKKRTKDEWIAEVKPFKPKDRVLYGVRMTDRKTGDVQTGVFEMSYFNYEDQLQAELDRAGSVHEEDILDFFEAEGGHTLRVCFEENSMGGNTNTFPRADRIDFRERDDLADGDVSPCLDHLLIVPTYEETEAMLWGAPINEKKEDEDDPDEEDDDDADDSPDEDDDSSDSDDDESDNDSDFDVDEWDGESCPSGHTFGTDANNKPDCPDCHEDVWEKCEKEQDKLKAAAKAKRAKKTDKPKSSRRGRGRSK